MKTKHTTGPWIIGEPMRVTRQGFGEYEATPIYGSGIAVAECSSMVSLGIAPHTRPMVAANARLIAAAPDLLQAASNALLALREHLCQSAHESNVSVETLCPCWGDVENLESVIARINS